MKKLFLLGLLVLSLFLLGCVGETAEECEGMTGVDKDVCYFEKAEETLEKSYCDKIENVELKSGCREVVWAEGG